MHIVSKTSLLCGIGFLFKDHCVCVCVRCPFFTVVEKHGCDVLTQDRHHALSQVGQSALSQCLEEDPLWELLLQPLFPLQLLPPQGKNDWAFTPLKYQSIDWSFSQPERVMVMEKTGEYIQRQETAQSVSCGDCEFSTSSYTAIP